VWDADDVINDLLKLWLNRWKINNPDCLIDYNDLKENPPDRIMGLNRNNYLNSLDGFRLSDEYRDMKPVPEVDEWFRKNGDKYHHMVLTGVPLKAAHVSSYWIIKNFGRWIRSFNFIPAKRGSEIICDYHITKKEFIEWFGNADVFIDDTEENIEGLAHTGVKPFLFPRPWNSSCSTIHDFFREFDSYLKHLEK